MNSTQEQFLIQRFGLEGRTVVVIGGGGILGGMIAEGFGRAGAKVAIADLKLDLAQSLAERMQKEGLTASAYPLDVLNQDSLEKCCSDILADYGRVDVLLNAAGGNHPGATTSPQTTFFDISRDGLQKVIDLNLMGGAILPAQVFGRHMVKNPDGGVFILISSMNALRPLTRICGYSASKAAVSNFTQWLAVHLAQEYGPKLRVNALAPGFFLTDQNRYLLVKEDGQSMTPRGKQILDHTPLGRYGDPDDLVGTAIWLASDASRFVTGIVVPVDGGFSAYSGV